MKTTINMNNTMHLNKKTDIATKEPEFSLFGTTLLVLLLICFVSSSFYIMISCLS
jgi:hypothetical protein